MITSKYYILTRFNSISFPERSKYMKHNLDDDWLKRRLKIFKYSCVPSILSQSNQDFEWIVYCHPESPDWFIKELEAIDRLSVSFQYWYHDALDMDNDIIVTSRVDTDDMLRPEYMERIHNHEQAFIDSGLDQQVYTFTSGFVYEKSTYIPTKVYSKGGPFHTLFSKLVREPKHRQVYHIRHEYITKQLPTFFDDTYAAWVYTRHDGNISGCDFTEIK